MKHESDSDANCNWCASDSHQRINIRTGELRNKRTSGDHPKYSIGVIGQNTEKNPGDLREIAVTQTQVKNHPLMLVWKNPRMSKIIIMLRKWLNNTIWCINETLPDTTNLLLVRVNLGVIVLKKYSTFLRFPGLELHHQIQFNVIPRIYVLTLLQKCNRRILHPQTTGWTRSYRRGFLIVSLLISRDFSDYAKGRLNGLKTWIPQLVSGLRWDKHKRRGHCLQMLLDTDQTQFCICKRWNDYHTEHLLFSSFSLWC